MLTSLKQTIVRNIQDYLGVVSRGGGVSTTNVGPLLSESSFMKSLWQLGATNESNNSVDKPYSNSIWVYASIMARAKNTAKVPLRLYNRDGAADAKPITDPNNKIFKLLRNPNPYMTGRVFKEAMSIFLDIFGEACLLMQREDVTVTPQQIWTFNPKRFTEVYNEAKTAIIGWTYDKGDGKKPVPLRFWEVLLLKYFNPYNDIRGMSPLDPARLGVNQDWYTSKYNENFFKQGARLSGIITVPGELDDNQFNRMITQFEESHTGVDRVHRVALFEGGATFTETKITQKDMDFGNLKKLSRTEIFAAYKVNEIVLGLYDDVKSRDGIKTAHKAFWEESMMPHLMYIEEYLNDTLFLQIEQGRYKVQFDLATVGALHEDFSDRVNTAEQLAKMGYPINSINDRLQLQMPKVAWGDVWWVPASLTPATDILNGDNNKEKPNAKPADKPHDKPSDKPSGDGGSKPKPPDTPSNKPKDGTEELWERYVLVQARVEEFIKSKFKKYIFDQRKTVLECIAKDKTVDLNKETIKLQRLMASLYAETIKIGANMIDEEIGPNNTIEFSLEFPEVEKYLQLRLELIPIKIMKRISDAVIKIMSKKELKELKAESIRILYNNITKRAGLIARNESSSVLNVGRVIQMQRSGVRHHRWISSKRDTSRESHTRLNNRIVRIGDSFIENMTLRYPGDLMAPIDETGGCTCFTMIANKKEEQDA